MAIFWKHDATRHAGAVVENAARQQPLFPGMGGTTGGERERDSERVILTAFSWQPGLWPEGGPPEPAEFWVHWNSEEAVQAAVAWNDRVRVRALTLHEEMCDGTIWQQLG